MTWSSPRARKNCWRSSSRSSTRWSSLPRPSSGQTGTWRTSTRMSERGRGFSEQEACDCQIVDATNIVNQAVSTWSQYLYWHSQPWSWGTPTVLHIWVFSMPQHIWFNKAANYHPFMIPHGGIRAGENFNMCWTGGDPGQTVVSSAASAHRMFHRTMHTHYVNRFVWGIHHRSPCELVVPIETETFSDEPCSRKCDRKWINTFRPISLENSTLLWSNSNSSQWVTLIEHPVTNLKPSLSLAFSVTFLIVFTALLWADVVR